MTNWKLIAIIFITLFTIENMFMMYGFYLIEKDDDNSKICFWEICEDYVDADYIDGVCKCYEENMFGSLVIGESEVLD